MKLAWAEQMSVGNAVIDSDHRNLIGVVEDVMRAIGERNHRALKSAFEMLESMLSIHFANEEHIAQAIRFDFSKHKPAQQFSLNEIRNLRDELISKKGVWTDGAVDHFNGVLKRWMIEGHITNLDMLMKPVLLALDYEYWPGWKEGETNHTAGHIANLYMQLFDKSPMDTAASH
jgi:hemerythrin-like metal-binding protein